MKSRILLLISFLALFVAAQAQRVRMVQIEGGLEGQIPIVQSSGNLQLVTPSYVRWTDTLSRIATWYQLGRFTGALINDAVVRANGNVVLKQAGGDSILISGLPNYFILRSFIGQPNGVAPLGPNGIIPDVYLPVQRDRERYIANSQAAMLALPALRGDEAIRTDDTSTYFLRVEPANVLANWYKLPDKTGSAATTTVNDVVGPNIRLTTANIPEGGGIRYFNETLARAAFSGTAGQITYNSTTGAFGLASVGTAGQYNLVTTDAQARVISGTMQPYLLPSALAPYPTTATLTTPGAIQIPAANITGLQTGGLPNRYDVPHGTSASFTLPTAPTGQVLLLRNGVVQNLSNYSISGTAGVLGFSRAPDEDITILY